MKTRKALLISVLAVLFMGWGITSTVLAQESGAALESEANFLLVLGSLNAPPTATDVYHVFCVAGSARLDANVRDLGGADGVRFTVVAHDAGAFPAASITGLDNGPSPTISVLGGPGSYFVAVLKFPSGTIEKYELGLQCRNAAGAPTDTRWALVQNQ